MSIKFTDENGNGIAIASNRAEALAFARQRLADHDAGAATPSEISARNGSTFDLKPRAFYRDMFARRVVELENTTDAAWTARFLRASGLRRAS